MNLKQKIEKDLKEAMRQKEELKLSVLRMLSAAIHNKEIEKRAKSGESELSEDEIVSVIRSESKKRRDAVEGFKQGGRTEMAEKESAELKILEGYLPREIADEEIEKIVREIKESQGATDKDFGKVMGEVMKKIKGQASGDRISRIVKDILG